MIDDLQSLADPNTVLICPATRRLVGELYDCRDLGPTRLKGFAADVRVTRVIGESAVGGRFEALRAASLIPLVGREEQLDLLLRRWERARSGAGQVVLISGEPGLGGPAPAHHAAQLWRPTRQTPLDRSDDLGM